MQQSGSPADPSSDSRECSQEIAWTFGGEECVQAHNKREYGVADINVVPTGSASADALFKGIAEDASVRLTPPVAELEA